MAAHIGHSPRSRRFIKVYLCTWALLAIGALGYLAMLAFPPQIGAPPHASVGPGSNGPGESKAVAEVRAIKGSLTEIRKDVSQLQVAVGERVINEKVVQTRLTALEERVSTIDSSPPGKAGGDARQDEPASPSAPGIETGSIATTGSIVTTMGSIVPKAEIVFGDPVVTPAGQAEFAVQLAAGTSVQVLKQSWGQLAERHAGALATLRPRIVSPRSEGGLYRLLAGPVPTKADAERICSELGVGPKACFPTPYTGAPL